MVRGGCTGVMVVFVAAGCSASRSAISDGGLTGGRGADAGGMAGQSTGGAGPGGTGGTVVGGTGGAAGGGAAPGGTTGQGGASGGGMSGKSGGGAAGGAPAACTLPDAQRNEYLDLEVRGEGFASHAGKTIFVFSRESRVGILGAASATIAGGTFLVRLPGGVRRGAERQHVSWFVDADGDGRCNTAGGDDPGFRAIEPFDPSGVQPLALLVSDNHATSPWVHGACDGTTPFEELSDLAVAATGFTEHAGATVHVLTRAVNGAVLGSGQATVAGGNWSILFPRAYAQFTYQDVLWFVDGDGDGMCTAGDHPGYVSTNAATPTGNAVVTTPITDNHQPMTARHADVCIVMNGCPIAP